VSCGIMLCGPSAISELFVAMNSAVMLYRNFVSLIRYMHMAQCMYSVKLVIVTDQTLTIVYM